MQIRPHNSTPQAEAGCETPANVSGLLLAFVLFLAGPPVLAQNASVSGFVNDGGDGQPLEGVHILVLDEAGETRGSVSNRDGLFFIGRLNPGRYIFRASFIGYAPHSDTIDLAPGQRMTINITLGEAELETDEVVVEAERTHGAARITAGQQTIRPADIELVPAPDVSSDLAMYLTTLPGIVTVGDRGGQLFIRGGEPAQNMVLVDGMLVYQPFHILGFYSAFPSEMLNQVDVYAGGHGSRYSGRISSVIDVATRQGNRRRFQGSFSAAPFVSSLHLEGPIVRDKVSFLASGRQSVIEHGAAQYIQQPLPYNFGDLFGKLSAELGNNSRVSVTALRTFDRGVIGEDVGGRPPDNLRWENNVIGARYLLLPRSLPIMTDIKMSFSELRTAIGPLEDPDRSSRIFDTNFAIDATFFGSPADFAAGMSIRFMQIANDLGGSFQDFHADRAVPTHVAFYLEPDINIGESLRLRPGLVMESLGDKGFPHFEPRIRMVWSRGVHQISGAGGYYMQDIIGLNDRRDATSVFTAWTETLVGRREVFRPDPTAEDVLEAYHALLGYRVAPGHWLELSVEGYHKWLSNLVISEWTAFPRFTTRQQHASGRSYGADARLEIRRPHFYGYLNYGFSTTDYWARQESLTLWYGEERLKFRPPHDRRHQVNALGSTRLFNFDISARWQFGSGLPFSQIVGFDGFVLMEGLVDVREDSGDQRVIYERPFRGVLPTYHRLDLSVERTFSTETTDLTLQASVLNAYNRANVFYLDLFTLHRVDQLPIVPTLGVKVSFK